MRPLKNKQATVIVPSAGIISCERLRIFDSINEHFEEHFCCANTNAERLASQTLEPDTSTFVVCMDTDDWR